MDQIEGKKAKEEAEKITLFQHDPAQNNLDQVEGETTKEVADKTNPIPNALELYYNKHPEKEIEHLKEAVRVYARTHATDKLKISELNQEILNLQKDSSEKLAKANRTIADLRERLEPDGFPYWNTIEIKSSLPKRITEDALEKETERLKNQLCRVQKELETQRSVANELKEEKSTLVNKLRRANYALKDAKKETVDSQYRRSYEREAHDKFLSRVTKSSHDVERLEFVRLLDEKFRLEVQVQCLQKDYSDVLENFEQNLDRQLKFGLFESKINQEKAENQTLNLKKDLEIERKAYEDYQKDIVGIIEGLEKKNVELKKEIQAWKQEIDLQAVAEEKYEKKMEKENSDLKKEVKELQEDLDEVEEEAQKQAKCLQKALQKVQQELELQVENRQYDEKCHEEHVKWLKNEIQKAKNEEEKAKKELEDVKKEAEEAEEALKNELQKVRERVINQLMEATKALEQAENKVLAMENDFTSHPEYQKDLGNVLDSMETDNNQLRKELKKLQKDQEEAQNHSGKAEKQVQSLKKALKQARKGLGEAPDNKLEMQNKILKRENAKLHEKLDDIRKEVVEFKKSLEKDEKSRIQLEIGLQDATEALKTAERQFLDLKTQVELKDQAQEADMNKAKKEILSLKKKLEEAQKQAQNGPNEPEVSVENQLKMSIFELKKALGQEEAGDSEDYLKELQTILKSIEKEHQELEKDVVELKERLETQNQAQNLQGAMEKAQEKLKFLLEARQYDKNCHEEQLKKAKNEAEKVLEQARKELEDVKKEANEAQNQLQKARIRAEYRNLDYQKENMELKKEVSKLRDAQILTERALYNAREEIEYWKTELDRLAQYSTKTVESLKNEKMKLEKELEEARKHVEDLQKARENELFEAKNALEQAQDQFHAHPDYQKDIADMIDTMEMEKLELKKELSELQGALRQSQVDNQNLKKKLEWEESVADLQGFMADDMEMDKHELKEKLVKMRKELMEKDEKIKKLEKLEDEKVEEEEEEDDFEIVSCDIISDNEW